MIVIDFIVDEAVIGRDVAEGGPAYDVDEAAWFMTWFELPIRFAVDTAELLERVPEPAKTGLQGEGWITVPGFQDNRYTPMAIVGFAVTLWRAARSSSGTASHHRLGPLRIERMHGTNFRIENRSRGAVAIVNEAELRKVTTELLLRVKALLVSRAPEIISHPEWHNWFCENAGPN